MYPEPRLIGPIIGSLAGAFCFWVGRYIVPEEYQAIRALFVIIGGVCILFAIFGWADWVAYKFGAHLKIVKEAWDAPKLEYARTINTMTRDQLRVFEHTAVFETIGYLGNTGMRYVLYTPKINIPFTFVVDYLEDCAPKYPYLVPQYGIPDNLKREYIQAFTRLMVNNGLAESAIGNKPARWLKSLSEVQEILGLSEE